MVAKHQNMSDFRYSNIKITLFLYFYGLKNVCYNIIEKKVEINMNFIINYILKMIPYMIGVIPIFIVIRMIFYKINKKSKVNLKSEVLMLMFFMFIIGIYSQAITGSFSTKNINISKINVVPFKIFIDTYKEMFVNGNINYFIISFLGNIGMFIPIGLLIPAIWKIKDRIVILIGFLISLSIELSQLFLNRGTDIDDLIFNTLGTIIGLMIYKIISGEEKVIKKK